MTRAIALLLLPLLLLPAACTEQSTPPPAPVDTTAFGDEVPIEQMYNYRIIDTVGGVVQWILLAQKMQKFENREEVELFDLEMRFFQDGERTSTLTALRGRANETTKHLFVWDRVRVVTERGWRLETEELYYDNLRERIYNDVFDRFTRGADWGTGYGLEATPDLEYFELKRDTRGEIGDETRDGEGDG